jgi:hypothetical protein
MEAQVDRSGGAEVSNFIQKGMGYWSLVLIPLEREGIKEQGDIQTSATHFGPQFQK